MTAPASSERHIAAVVATVDAALRALSTPRRAYNGARPDSPTPDKICAIIHGTPGQPSGSLGDRFADLELEFQVTAVGEGPEQALAIADVVRVALLATPPPSVAGRAVWPLWQTAAQPVQRDDTIQPPLWIATAQYVIKSNPA